MSFLISERQLYGMWLAFYAFTKRESSSIGIDLGTRTATSSGYYIYMNSAKAEQHSPLKSSGI